MIGIDERIVCCVVKMASAEQVGLNKTWELSLYELHRTPQDAITDNTEIAVSPRSLHSELMCPICLDMLKKTMTTKECLHRFCSDCIITALRSGNKVNIFPRQSYLIHFIYFPSIVHGKHFFFFQVQQYIVIKSFLLRTTLHF